MIRGYGADQIRAAEAPALSAGEPLMQRAAGAVAALVREQLPAAGGDTGLDPRVLVLVGGGNNGGDGLFAAADLATTTEVVVVLTRSEVHADGLAAARAAGVDVIDLSGTDPDWDALAEVADDADVWVDALAGIGVSGALRGSTGEVVTRLLALREAASVPPLVVAVDIPSGVDADTGAVGGPVLPADLTLTFGAPKAGLLLPPGSALVGDMRVTDLGLEEALLAQPWAVGRLRDADAVDLWPWPDASAHKYTRGVVGVLAGSEDYPGAAVLTTGAAARTGCGMVRYLGPPTPTGLVLHRWPEVVTAAGRVQSLVVGPGTGPDDEGRRAELRSAIEQGLADEVALVVDAGALDLLPERDHLAGARVVLTPHAGELAALLTARGEDVDRAAVEADPARWARRAAVITGATVLAKGPTTLAAGPDGELLSQSDGTGWMATAGSGDVLAGVLGALLAGMPDVPVPTVAALAALVHGRAGTVASGVADGGRGGPIVASDIVDALPGAIRDLLAGHAVRES